MTFVKRKDHLEHIWNSVGNRLKGSLAVLGLQLFLGNLDFR
jgi:hypothetical protein